MIDHRIRFDAPLINFATSVGLSGQAHDDYPGPGQQARYDWMRIYLIGLLANQSGNTAPSQFREGTLWFDLADETMKVRRIGAWVSLSQGIKLADTDNPAEPYTLQDWYDDVNEDVQSLRNEIVFHGLVQSINAGLIPIPTSLQPLLQTNSRPFVWVNGSLVNPATTTLEPGANPTAVRVPNGIMTQGSEVVVVIKFIPDSRFNISPVTI